MKNVLTALVFLIVVGSAGCLGLFLWKLHLWIRPGTALRSGKWRFRDYEFQVWQRKNQSVLEPFADGLFARRGTNEWEVFCFDIQDIIRRKSNCARSAPKWKCSATARIGVSLICQTEASVALQTSRSLPLLE